MTPNMQSSNPYVYQRPSTLATRSLVSNNKADELSPTSSNASSPGSTTTHYERAAAEATRADHIPATTAGSVLASVTDRPGMMRQPSWKMADLKGQQQGQMLAGVVSGHGYSTTASPGQ